MPPPRPALTALLAGTLLVVSGAVVVFGGVVDYGAGAVLGAASLPAAAGGTNPPPPDPETALERGNRHFRTGRLEEALATYRSGWNPRRPDPVLAYNLGTTAHHLARPAEAVLWYRRAVEVSDGDRWLIENLERARSHLDAPRMAPPDLVTRLAGLQGLLWGLAALTGCAALALLISRRPGLERPADVLTVVTAGLLVAALLLPRLAATPAVVLGPCGGLPPGSEVWTRPGADGGFEVGTEGGTTSCPAGSVEPVTP